MGKLLLDTHALLWWLSEPERLSAEAHRVISEGHHPILVSAATAWEMAIKKSLGRLDYPGNLLSVLKEQGIATLAISPDHALAVADLPLHHHDPFDRVLIAQARSEEMTLLTRDAAMTAYDVQILPA